LLPDFSLPEGHDQQIYVPDMIDLTLVMPAVVPDTLEVIVETSETETVEGVAPPPPPPLSPAPLPRKTWPIVIIVSAADDRSAATTTPGTGESAEDEDVTVMLTFVDVLQSDDGNQVAKVAAQRIVWRDRVYELSEFFGAVAVDIPEEIPGTQDESGDGDAGSVAIKVDDDDADGKARTSTTEVTDRSETEVARGADDDEDEDEFASACLVCLSAGRAVAVLPW
jgi:hypothetical protein